MEKSPLDIVKVQYFEKTDSEKQREFINSQSNCVLCGTILELMHTVDKIISHIQEEAHCRACDIRTRARFYPLN